MGAGKDEAGKGEAAGRMRSPRAQIEFICVKDGPGRESKESVVGISDFIKIV